MMMNKLKSSFYISNAFQVELKEEKVAKLPKMSKHVFLRFFLFVCFKESIGSTS